MNNSDILRTALHQSALDLGCSTEDLTATDNRIVLSKQNDSARKYLTLPFDVNLVSYGGNIVASVQEKYRDIVAQYIGKYPAAHAFETPHLHALDDMLAPHGLRTCFMAEYFLPDVTLLQPIPCPYETRILTQTDFAPLYLPQWSNALCEKRKHLDVLGIGAYDKGELIAMAACSADCDSMWQIGIDVLPAYRRQGIAPALTSRLALEIIERGKVPFYCAAWCNIKSVRSAIRSGFRPAWVELTAKPIAFVDKMNS